MIEICSLFDDLKSIYALKCGAEWLRTSIWMSVSRDELLTKEIKTTPCLTLQVQTIDISARLFHGV